jgi:hypothetical protein
MLLPFGSGSSHYRETGGTRWGMLIAWESSISLLDDDIIEESDNQSRRKIIFVREEKKKSNRAILSSAV